MNRLYMPKTITVKTTKPVSTDKAEFPSQKREPTYYTFDDPDKQNPASKITDFSLWADANRYENTCGAEIDEVMSGERSRKRPASTSSAQMEQDGNIEKVSIIAKEKTQKEQENKLTSPRFPTRKRKNQSSSQLSL